MNLIIAIRLLFKKLFLLPKFLFFMVKDYIFYYLDRQYEVFDRWGLHVYVGRFGAGKTSSMVYDAYLLACQYPGLTIVTNLHLTNFPDTVNIFPLRSPQDILNAPDNTLVLIDEIGTIFNSRDFSTKKEGVPKILFQHICQCRHRHLMIYGTTQRWNFLDKQLRDIAATVRHVYMSFDHPFSRLATVYSFDAVDFDKAFENPLLPLPALSAWTYVQTDFIRSLYDTKEMVDSLLKADYLPDDEILKNQGYNSQLVEVSAQGRKNLHKNSKLL